MRRISYYQWEQIREEIILLCIQWYIFYSLTYEELQEVIAQRGFAIDNDIINKLVEEYSVIAQKRWEKSQRRRKRGWRLVEIPFKINYRRKYLYRALDAQGNTLDFIIYPNSNKYKAHQFFQKTISSDLEKTNKILLQKKSRQSKQHYFLSSLIFLSTLILVGYIILDNIPFDTESIPNNIEEQQNN
ncbi:MAG: DDE-type integrase/transposase/recombinase [Cyanobacterium sp.]